MLGYSEKWHQHSVGKFTVVYQVHIYYAMTTTLVACVLLSLLCESSACLDILENDIITLLENSLWCIECRFTMQWQQCLLPVSYSLIKTVLYVHCPYIVLTVSLCCPYVVLMMSLFQKEPPHELQKMPNHEFQIHHIFCLHHLYRCTIEFML